MLVDGTPVHVVLDGLDGLARGHGAQEGAGVGVGQLSVLVLLGTLIIVWLPLVVVLDLAAHSNKRHEGRILLDVLEEDKVAILPGQILGLPHEEDVSAARLLPLGSPPLLHLALVFVEALDPVEGGEVAEGAVAVPLDGPAVVLPQLDRPHVRRDEGRGQLHAGRRVLQQRAASSNLQVTI